MQILKIRLKNLNSLVGEWTIDFTHPVYGNDGIFAITGPTGAGKTTILDSICLALYGQTPRLKKITKNANEIMSRLTGETFAEVEFETARGRFRCHWSQHRARKKSNGELQNPRHEIVNAETGDVLESKLKEVPQRVEAATGMDFHRFTRSMMLAQGGFAAFLLAPSDERAPILEQITGTEIYSRISMKVHERKSDETGKMEKLQAEVEGTQLMPEVEERELRKALEEKEHAASDLEEKLKTSRQAMEWLAGVKKLESDLDGIKGAWSEFETRNAEAQPELRRLEGAEKALALEGVYTQITTARDLQKKETDELAQSREKMPDLEAEQAKTAEALRNSEAMLRQEREDQQRKMLDIKTVRELDIKIAESRSHIEALDKSIRLSEKERWDYHTEIDHAEKALAKSGKLIEENQAFLDGHGGDEKLIEDLAGIRQRFHALQELHAGEDEKRKALKKAAATMEGAARGLLKKEKAWEKSLEGAKELEDRLKQLRDDIKALLKDRDISSRRDEIESLNERVSRLKETKEILEGIVNAGKKLEELKKQRETLDTERLEVESRERTAGKEQEWRNKLVHQLEAKVSLLNRVRSLEEERKRLADGKPCPLCGATEHPYINGNAPHADKAETELETARHEQRDGVDRLTKLKIKRTGIAKDLEQVERHTTEKVSLLNQAEKDGAEAFGELNLSLGDGGAQIVRDELSATEIKIKQCRDITQQGEKRIEAERKAREAWDKAKESLNKSEQSLGDSRHGNEKAKNERQRLQHEYEAYADELKKASDNTLQHVEPYGVQELSPDRAEDILKALTKRRNTWKRKQEEGKKEEGRITGLMSDKEKAQALLAKLESDLEGLRKDHALRRDKLEVLVDQRKELFGDKKPEHEEQRLVERVNHAETKREEARKALSTIERDVDHLRTRMASLTESTEKREKEELGPEEKNFARQMTQSGFTDEGSYKEARLPKDERERLLHLRETLEKDKNELNARRQDKSDALKTELDKKLTDQSHDALKEEVQSREISLKELQRIIGAVRQRLEENARQLEKRKERLQVMKTQEKECARWNRLHELIGSADGKKFRNFAQGLTFEMMIAHANRQLQKMSDRYLLIRDDIHPLELNVIDSYQAGEIRSTKNLSGGESFIVSLALALGLSRMAGLNVRVDSLFLDEGFGSLDDDALETALDTLAGLQQDGKLIGVISHVPALKERIAVQIRVHSGTSGRSRIEGPGCAFVESGGNS